MEYALRVANIEDSTFLAKARIDFLRLLGYEIKESEYENVVKVLIEQIERKINYTLICIIAENRKEMVGTAYMTIDERLYHPSTPKGRIANIVNVYTSEEARGKGIASEMVKKLIELAGDYSVEKVTLDATPMGESVYRKLGFSSEKDSILPTPMYYYINK